MIHHPWLTVLVHHFACILWVIFPVTEPVFECLSADGKPLPLGQITRLAVGRFRESIISFLVLLIDSISFSTNDW